MKNKIIYLISFLIVFSSFVFAKETRKIIVTNSSANIRTLPGMEGEIIRSAKNGDSFVVLEKKGKWYKISFKGDKKGKSGVGYIHSSIVELVSKGSKKKIYSKKKSSKRKKITSRKRGKNHSQEELFSGYFLKGGVMTSPTAGSFGNKLLVSFGFDKAIGKYLTWGIELEPYFRSFSDDASDLSINDLATNIFLNIKGGINLGKLFEFLKPLTLYAGGGIGTNLNYSSIKLGSIKGTQFDLNFSWHLIFGTEIKIGKMDLVFEIQNNKIILKDVDPASQSISFLFLGIRF